MGGFNIPGVPAGIQQNIPNIAQLWGMLQQGNENQWMKAAIINILNQMRAGEQIGLDRANESLPLIRDLLINTSNPMSAFTTGGVGDLWNQLQNFTGGIPGLFRDSGQFMTPGMQAGLSGLAGAAGGMQGPMGTAAQIFQGGGWSLPGQQLMDMAMSMGGGQGWEMGQQATTGGSLLGNFGINPYTAATQQYGLQGLQSGGRTPYTDALAQFGMMGLMGGGLTPTGQVGEASALETLLQGGQTPISNYMQQLGATQASDEPLLPMTQALSMARDQAGTAAAQQAQAYMQRALARGGGPGAVIASGLQNQGMREFSDTALAQEAQAMREMALQQQQLQLQRQAQGGALAQQQAALENQRLQTMMGGLGNLEDTAARRYLGAGGWLGEAQGQATNLMNVLGNLGLGGVGAETARMNTGGTLLNNYNQARIAGMRTGQDILQGMNQYGLGAGNLFNQMAGTQGGLFNNLIAQELAAGQLGMNRASAIANAMNQGFGQQGSLLGNAMSLLSSTFNPLLSLYTTPFDAAFRLMAAEPALINRQPFQSPYYVPPQNRQKPGGSPSGGAASAPRPTIGGGGAAGGSPSSTYPTGGTPAGAPYPGMYPGGVPANPGQLPPGYDPWGGQNIPQPGGGTETGGELSGWFDPWGNYNPTGGAENPGPYPGGEGGPMGTGGGWDFNWFDPWGGGPDPSGYGYGGWPGPNYSAGDYGYDWWNYGGPGPYPGGNSGGGGGDFSWFDPWAAGAMWSN